jgi:arginyl-tRNA synthetase
MQQNPDALESEDIGVFYAAGAKAYETDKTVKTEIDGINARVYGDDPSIKTLYAKGRERSFAGFDRTLQNLGIRTDRRYLESESAAAGLEMVKQNTGKVFVKSDGAVVYEGEKAGLHTRVFITGKGLPTYEAKDLGLTSLKDEDYPEAKLSVIITAHEQAEYFKVMLAALAEINPATAKKTRHVSHGFVSLSTGKMSSRTGEVYGADDLLQDVSKTAKKLFPEAAHEVELGAVKYAFARHRLGGDIVYDINESVSLEGNSGPYLQYAHARARSVLRKARKEAKLSGELQPDERLLVRKLGEYAETVDKAVQELMPHHVCTYLYELAQEFNRFYEKNRVIGDPREPLRLALVRSYAETLQLGLQLLGMRTPDKM